MEPINVKLFSTPSVTREDTRIVFPSRKIEALFYYIVVNKEAAREELSSLLWPDANAQTGRKNVRNALYYIKKSLDRDIIISPNRDLVTLNPEVQISLDLDRLLSDDEWIDAYTGDFLQGFAVKDEEVFEDWIMSSREKYKSLYVQKLYKKIKEDFTYRDYQSAEQCARRLIEIDEYDEKAYRVLMKAFAEMNMYNKAADIYNRLLEILERDLGIVPDIKSRELFQNIQERRSSAKIERIDKGKRIFYGREQELAELHSNYDRFKSGRDYNSILIIGEAGIGKTALKDKFLEEIRQDDNFIMESNCYQAEEEFPLRPWNGILSKMLNIIGEERLKLPFAWRDILEAFFPSFASYDEKSESAINIKANLLRLKMLEETIISLLSKISKLKKTIVVFDDIQWMDNLSISLLSGILLHLTEGVVVIAACRNGRSQRVEDFIVEMVKHNRLNKIELDRFTKDEVTEFARRALPDYNFKNAIYENIYKETEGNTFFIVECINSLRENREMDMMSARMTDILKSRFIGINEEGVKILNISSMFFDEISIEVLAEISGVDKLKLLDILDDLKNRFIIKEIDNKSSPSIIFTHQKLREFIYNIQSASRKQVLHNRIGRILETRLVGDDRDIVLYPKLIYHFSKSGDMESALKYNIKTANFYLDFSHELFPTLYGNYNIDIYHPYLTTEDSLKYLSNIEEQLVKLKESYPIMDQITLLEIAFCHMKGRYLIRQGQYERGIKLIKDMISSSLRVGEIDYALKGYRQMIYYGIQTRDMQIMKENVEAGLKMAREYSLNADIGMFLRLYGLYKIMNKEYEQAEDLLKQCINRFLSIENCKDKYSMHIAAAYSYLGDIRRYNMRFQSSLEYYDKAISLCESKMAGSSLATFCTNAGQAAFDAGDYIRAKSYFMRAFETYKKVDSIWGRGTAEGYMALLLIAEGNYKEAIESLKRADQYSDKIKNPYEIGLIYRIKAEIRYKMESNNKLNQIFIAYLNMNRIDYCEEGIKRLKEVNDKYQIDILNMFAEQR
ncbi:AAA family ATPase [Lutispora sp.]|uniref:AAA family ATPase n=1 Tax=Lutispora sp. TaxID=2828727 RepID=UPI002B2033B9|nr:AAA family ATPase [Lutispora sp.]MEA4960657.1 AAA family ATPase [Lutispora sp.]